MRFEDGREETVRVKEHVTVRDRIKLARLTEQLKESTLSQLESGAGYNATIVAHITDSDPSRWYDAFAEDVDAVADFFIASFSRKIAE